MLTSPPPSVALTFDDGPDPVWTPRVLAALEAAGARATFFVIAPHAVAHPELVEQTLEAGHDVELHCHRHLRHTETTRHEIERDTDAALATLGCLGLRPSRWRVPWGMEAEWTGEVAAARGLELVGWSIDTHDWRGDGAAEMLAFVRPRLKPGGVVLMHDALGPGALRDGCEATLALVPLLAEAIRDCGLEPDLLRFTRARGGGVSAATDLRAGAASLPAALEDVAAGAADRDAHPGYPHQAFARLAAAGALSLDVPGRAETTSFAEDLATVRAVARADGSVGRIYDGHVNAVERLGLVAPEPLRCDELARIAAGELTLGVWGADPLPAEGEPARLDAAGEALHGTKIFCSGAGGVDRALVNVRAAEGSGPPVLAYVDLAEGVEIDRTWFRGAGMRASESHRVTFDGASVLAVLGEPGELSRQPWFSRDGIRTAATWAGVLDSAVADALDTLRAKPARGQLEELAAGRMLAEQTSVDLWLAEAGRRDDHDGIDLAFSVALREAVASASRRALDEAARACGSRPFAVGSALDRARRDLEIFLLQHRLDPLIARVGAASLGTPPAP